MKDNKQESGELDEAALIQLLKDKAKDLKNTQKKLAKVEGKYVEMHREHKNLLSDRETFIQFLHVIFPQNLLEDEILTIPEGPDGFGMFDVNHLK